MRHFVLTQIRLALEHRSGPSIHMVFKLTFYALTLWTLERIPECPASIFYKFAAPPDRRQSVAAAFFLFSYLLPPRRIVFPKPCLHTFGAVIKSCMEKFGCEKKKKILLSGTVCESLGFWVGRHDELLPGETQSILSSLPLALSAFIHVLLVFLVITQGTTSSFLFVLWPIVPDCRQKNN